MLDDPHETGQTDNIAGEDPGASGSEVSLSPVIPPADTCIMYSVETIAELQRRAIAWGPIGVARTVDPQECHDQFLAEHGDFCSTDPAGGRTASGEHWDVEFVIEYPIQGLTNEDQGMSLL